MYQSLFVYGTLKEPDVQRRIFGRIIRGTPDRLTGYRKSQLAVDGHVYPIIVLDALGSVGGHVLEVTADELRRADAYEGSDYRRVEVTLGSGKAAWVYCA